MVMVLSGEVETDRVALADHVDAGGGDGEAVARADELGGLGEEARLCDRAVLLKDGLVAFNGPTHEAIVEYRRLLAGERVPPELQQQLIELRTFDQFSKDAHGKFSGLMQGGVWGALVNTLKRYKEIKRKPAVSSLFTNQFNPNK